MTLQAIPKRCPICGQTTSEAAIIQASQVNAAWVDAPAQRCRAGAWLHFTSPKNGQDVVVFVKGWDAPPIKPTKLPGIQSHRKGGRG